MELQWNFCFVINDNYLLSKLSSLGRTYLVLSKIILIRLNIIEVYVLCKIKYSK